MLGLLLPWCGATLRAAGDADVAAAWELVARHLPTDAQARLGATTGGGREAAFAAAVVLLDRPPVTDAKLTTAAAQLADLARGDDEIAAAAGYLEARLYQAHFFSPDPARAARAYAALAARQPHSPWAQLGLVKLALLRLYVLPEPASPAARVAAAEALLAQVEIPALQRDLHLVLGRGRLFFQLPGVLPHLLAADRIGGLAGTVRSDLQLQIAELSRRAGEPAQARRYFKAFLAENEVDPRVYTVRARLAEMAGKEGTP